jgi:hypothetical protein
MLQSFHAFVWRAATSAKLRQMLESQFTRSAPSRCSLRNCAKQHHSVIGHAHSAQFSRCGEQMRGSRAGMADQTDGAPTALPFSLSLRISAIVAAAIGSACAIPRYIV